MGGTRYSGFETLIIILRLRPELFKKAGYEEDADVGKNLRSNCNVRLKDNS